MGIRTCIVRGDASGLAGRVYSVRVRPVGATSVTALSPLNCVTPAAASNTGILRMVSSSVTSTAAGCSPFTAKVLLCD